MLTFTITVYNQGLVTASNIVVTDYVPTGLIFNAADNTNFADNAGVIEAIVSSLEPGAQTDFINNTSNRP